MKQGFYQKIAATGIRNNRKMYLPYMLVTGMFVMIYYIMYYLSVMEYPEGMRGINILRTTMPMACDIVALFSLIFLFYISTFLLRRRSKEFGLYRILGMNKSNLCRILVHEHMLSGLLSITGGVLCGILCSKLAELLLYQLLLQPVSYAFFLPWKGIGITAAIYAAIELVLLVKAIWIVRRNNPLALFSGSRIGEKPPKANWLLAIAGLLLLATAYYMAVAIQNPVAAFTQFFIAVLLVIVATYLLFIAGSVALCKLLQTNKRFYYNRKHFVAVSSMVYRMKRNGAGLASICILSTIVLVTVSCISCLYFGTEKEMRDQYPYDIQLEIEANDADIPAIQKALQAKFAPYQGQIHDTISFFNTQSIGILNGSTLELPQTMIGTGFLQQIRILVAFSPEDYAKLTGHQVSLAQNECLLYPGDTVYTEDTLTIGSALTYQVKEILPEFDSVFSIDNVVSAFFLVVPDLDAFCSAFAGQLDSLGAPLVPLYWNYGFQLNCDHDSQMALSDRMKQDAEEILPDGTELLWSCYAEELEYTKGSSASLFFIGCLIAVVFFFATVLILYYKQISEGYEDQRNFAIMQRIGMQKAEIHQTIRTQMRMIFLLPVLFAGIHMLFAFGFTSKILMLFGLFDTSYMAWITGFSFIGFAILYTIVYRLTTESYYQIVSSDQDPA